MKLASTFISLAVCCPYGGGGGGGGGGEVIYVSMCQSSTFGQLRVVRTNKLFIRGARVTGCYGLYILVRIALINLNMFPCQCPGTRQI